MGVDQVDVLNYLHDKGVTTKPATRDEIHTTCWYCAEEPSKRGRLYINVSHDARAAGLHHCKKCDARGNLVTLMRHFGDELQVSDDEDWSKDVRVQQVLQVATEYYHNKLGLDHLKYLKTDRGFSAKTISNYKIGYADGTLYPYLRSEGYEIADIERAGLIKVKRGQGRDEEGNLILDGKIEDVFDVFRGYLTIPYLVAGNPVLIRGRKWDDDRTGPKYLSPPDQVTRMFNTDSTYGAESVVICEGEFDAMLVEQMGHASIGLSGMGQWQEKWNPYFDDITRVYVAFDADGPGQLGAAKIKENLGRKVRLVTMPDPTDVEPDLDPNDVDISEWFGKRKHDPEEFATLLRQADRKATMLVTPREAFEEWEEVQGKVGLKFGFEELDDYLHPGMLDGQVLVTLAKTNVGKTISLLNMFQGITMVPGQEDEGILFVSLEQTRGEWFERARRIWNFYNLDCHPLDVNAEALKYWENRIRITDVNRMNAESLQAAIQDYKQEMGKTPAFVAVDYLGYWARGFKGLSKYEQVGEAVMTLKEVAKEERCRIGAPHQVSRSQDFGNRLDLDSARDSGVIEETADLMWLMWSADSKSDTQVEDRTGQVNIRVGKTRGRGKGRETVLQFGYLSLAMVPIGDKRRAQLARDELMYDLRDDCSHIVEPWEAAMFRHKTGMKNEHIERFLLEERGRLSEKDDNHELADQY